MATPGQPRDPQPRDPTDGPFYDGNGELIEPIKLPGQDGTVNPNSETGKGGEGWVYAVRGRDDLAVKIWHFGREPKDADEKISYMAVNPVEPDPSATWRVIWPVQPVTREGVTVGYTMPRLDPDQWTEPIRFYNPSKREVTEKHQGRELRPDNQQRVAFRLALAFKAIHDAGYVVGDVNPKNFAINRNDEIIIFDCDSFEFTTADGKTFSNNMGMADFQAPERQRSHTDRTSTDDCFGLAVLIFYLYNKGNHPYNGRDENFNELGDRIAKWRFPRSADNDATTTEAQDEPWNALSGYLQQMFLRCFDKECCQRLGRPTAGEWVAALSPAPHPTALATPASGTVPWKQRLLSVRDGLRLPLAAGIKTIKRRLLLVLAVLIPLLAAAAGIKTIKRRLLSVRDGLRLPLAAGIKTIKRRLLLVLAVLIPLLAAGVGIKTIKRRLLLVLAVLIPLLAAGVGIWMISGGTWSGGSGVAAQSEPVTPTPALTIAPADTSGPVPTNSVPTPFVIIATAPAPEIAVVPTGRSSSAQPTLALTDFDTRGLRVEMLALFTAGNAGDQPALYSAARSRWPESGSLVAGEIGIGPEGTPIVRAVYLEDSNGLRLNDAGELALKVYFGEDGAGNDLTVSVQTTDGKTSFPVANNVSSSGDNYIRFNLPPGGKEIVGNIDPGDHFILALTRPATRAISGSAPTPTSVYTPPPTLTAPPTTEVPPPTPRLTPAQRLYSNATHSIVNAFHAAKRCACRAATWGI